MADPFTDLAIVAIIDGVVSGISAAVSTAILSALGIDPNRGVAQETQKLLIEHAVVDIQTKIHDTSDGLHAIREAVRTIVDDSSTILGRLDTIDTSISNIPQPPAGTSIADAVWEWELPSVHLQTWEAMAYTALGALELGDSWHITSSDRKWIFKEQTTVGEGDRLWTHPPIPTPDWTAILDTDTMLTWLQRTDTSGLTWLADVDTGQPIAVIHDTNDVGVGLIAPTMTDAEFNAVKPSAVSPTGRPVAPVWPGLDKVTLGQPIALSNGLVINSPLDGLIFAITRDSAGGGRWQFGEVSSWNNVGAVMFETDNGDFERAITIGVDTQVVVPLTMVRAAGAVVRFTNPFSGTVTPWTILAP